TVEEEIELIEHLSSIAANGDPKAIEKYFQAFPAGYRFAPKDHELIEKYLRPKIFDQNLPINNILIVNIYQHNPKDIAARYKLYEKDGKELYLFTPRDRKYPNGSRPNRAAQGGYWKATGADKDIYNMSTNLIGHKKTLVFYQGQANKGVKTEWIMHEFRLSDMTPRAKSHPKDMRLDDWVLVKLYLKKSDKEKTGNKKAVAEQEDDLAEEEDDDDDDEDEVLNVTLSDLGQDIALPNSVNSLEAGSYDDRRYEINVATGNENEQNDQQQIEQYIQDPNPMYHPENGQLVVHPENGLPMLPMEAANHCGHNNSGTLETVNYNFESQQPSENYYEQKPAEEYFDIGNNFWSLDIPQMQDLDFTDLLSMDEDNNSNNVDYGYNNNLPVPLNCYSNNILPVPLSEEKKLSDNYNPSKENKLTQKRKRIGQSSWRELQ
ncbi:Nac domain containing protein, partial [Thalictrum thalictroides]